MERIYTHQFDNGLHLLAEPLAGTRSLAMSLLLPAGVAHEPQGQQGVATVLAEMITRGAGTRDSRQHSEALDFLGVQRSASAQGIHLRIGATMIGDKFGEAFGLLADMVTAPQLSASALEPSRDLALQTLDSLEDEPQQKVMLELRSRHLPQPFGRPLYGSREFIEILTLDDIRRHWQSTFVPRGSVLAFAGCFDWDKLRSTVESVLGQWNGSREDVQDAQQPPRGYLHHTAETAQVHLGVAYDALPVTDENAMLQRASVAVLSGGMSGRLFTEVREKRGLCYSVGARYSGDKRHGMILSYCGTTAPRAQETLDVLTGELRRIVQGVDESEFQRAIVGMKSRLVMQGESSGARANAIAIDQYNHGGPRSLDELTDKIDAITLDTLNNFVREHPAEEMTIVTIGPKELDAQLTAPAAR